MSDSFWNFGITTALLFWRKKKKIWTCFKESKKLAVEKNLEVTIKFYKKLYVFQSSHGTKTIYRSKLYQ